ncbi:MAG: GntG family PLP-dependent aldolase [Gemmatimonadota bacterium]
MLDLRSDTVTQPTRAMRQAMADAEVGDDVLDGDPTVRRLEATVAELLGKERGLFFPTGSMANMSAVWVHTQPGTEVLLDADAHIVHWEIAGTAALSGVQVRPVRGAAGVFRASDLAAALRPPSIHAPEASLVCVENTHNGAGGVVTPLDELRALRDTARGAGLPLHLDGARLWNASAATGVSLADFAACADTVMVSFSKGLGAPVGAMLVGPATLITRAHRVRKRFGGGMRQSGFLAAAALHGLEHHLARLADDHAAARELAAAVDGAGGATVVSPDTNILMIDLPKPNADAVVERAAALGVRVSAWTTTRVRAVTHLDAPMARVREAAPRLRQALEEMLA